MDDAGNSVDTDKMDGTENMQCMICWDVGTNSMNSSIPGCTDATDAQGESCVDGYCGAFASENSECFEAHCEEAAVVATGYCSWSQCIEGYDARHQDTNTNTYQCHGSKAACDGVCSMLMPGKWCGDDAGDHSMGGPDCPNPMYVGAARGPLHGG